MIGDECMASGTDFPAITSAVHAWNPSTTLSQFGLSGSAEVPTVDGDATVAGFNSILKAYETAVSYVRQGAHTDGSLTATKEVFDLFAERLQDCAEELQDAVDKYRVPPTPEYCKVPPSREHAKLLVAYAHKLSYTTFAPPGFIPGATPLRNHRPPAPQDWQLRCSMLHEFAVEYAARFPAPSELSSDAAPPLPPDWNLSELPPMPAGWKPGDPLPGFDFAGFDITLPVPTTTTAEAAVPEPTPAPAPQPKPAFGLDLGIDLNPDLELEPAEEEYSSDSEQYSDDDDDM